MTEAILPGCWCSWCFDKTDHVQVEWSLLKRNQYECKACSRKTNCCWQCGGGSGAGMARNAGSDGASLLCARCDGTIKQWGERPQLHEEGYCSWCFNKTTHNLQKYNYLNRSVYTCNECKNRTIGCRKCSAIGTHAFARGHGTGADEELCFSCAGVIRNWDNPDTNFETTVLDRWCGWCYEKTKNKILEHHMVSGRDTYTCLNCDCVSVRCSVCEVGLARSGSGIAHDIHCPGCSQSTKLHEKITFGLTSNQKTSSEISAWWSSMRQRKSDVYKEQMATDHIKSELARKSPQRKMAFDCGMVRPFLLLVSMPPEMRNKVSCSLGWSTIAMSFFGDSHQESWEIISHPDSGIIARSKSVLQNVNPLADDCTYYQVVNRVIKTVYGKTEFMDLSYSETLPLCQSSANMQVPLLEEHIMKQLAKEQRSSMTKEQRQTEDEMAVRPDMRKMADTLRERAGLQSKEATSYAISVVKTAVRSPGTWGVTLFTLQAIQLYLPATAAVTAPAIAGVSAVIPPLAILGALRLFYQGVEMALGPSLARLYFPIVMMINQRLLMAAQDLKVESLY